MCKKSIYLTSFIFMLALCLMSTTQAQNIVWISETNMDANDVYFDQGWIDLLENAGYTVHYDPGTWMELDDDNLAILESADLIIASRNSNSGNYAADDAEIAQWNSIPTPMIMMTAYWSRSNRLLWINSETIEEYLPESMLQVVESTHPVFNGVTPVDGLVDVIDENVNDGENSFVMTNDVGNGILIAQRADDEAVWIAEWLPDIEFYDGSAQIPAGKRMLFLAGGGGGQEAGSFNLTEDGITIFFNAIDYMIGAGPRLKAFGPRPSNGQNDISLEPLLSWRPGTYAQTHDVYFGSVYDDVNEASRDNPLGVLVGQEQSEPNYNPGPLGFGRTYYWRVDEVNAPPDSTIIKGDTWTFSIVNFHVVDDFEDYNDYPPDRIYDTWIDGYGTTTNGSTVGYAEPDFNAGEHFVETVNTHNSPQAMPFFYDNTGRNSEATRPLTDLRDWTLDGVHELSLWFRGYLPEVGSFTEDPAGTYTMTATGTDIWDEADEFHFAYKELTGVGSIIAKVESVEQTDVWAKAGVMIRNTLEPDSRHAMVVVTPAQGVSFQRRIQTGSASAETTIADITAPIWVKIERDISGDFTGSYSADGVSWTQISVESINMSAAAYVGLVVTAHNPIEVCEAVFSNVSITGNVGQNWTNEDIGITSNAPQPMYVAVGNSTGEPVVVYHEDLNATVIPEWTEWAIPLQVFSDQGLDLTDVDSFGIGLGDRDNPQQNSGTGVMYIDEIRLYNNME